jgi:hypothetical protein
MGTAMPSAKTATLTDRTDPALMEPPRTGAEQEHRLIANAVVIRNC